MHPHEWLPSEYSWSGNYTRQMIEAQRLAESHGLSWRDMSEHDKETYRITIAVIAASEDR